MINIISKLTVMKPITLRLMITIIKVVIIAATMKTIPTKIIMATALMTTTKQ